MQLELVDPSEWDVISGQIDYDFGEGVTKKLLGKRVPVRMERNKKKSYYLIPSEWTQFLEIEPSGFDMKSLGVWLGELVNDQFRLSIAVIETLAEITESKILVAEIGAQSFTYGRSIIRESVIDIPQDLVRGQRVVVLDNLGRCIGLASLTVDAMMIQRLAKDRLVAKNIVDIGWYIRRLG
jgi:ribosome biogenesis protein Nip4